MRTKFLALFSMLIIVSMVLAACQPQTVVETVVVEKEGQTVVITATPEPEVVAPAKEWKSKDPTTFTTASFGDPETLDPALDYESGGLQVIQHVYDTLVIYNREDANSFVSNLATDVPSLENGGISEDGLTYIFNIRTGVKFHDGTDMTVEDVAYSFQRGLLQGGTFSPQWLFTEALFGVGVYDVTDLFDTAIMSQTAGVETLNDDPTNLKLMPAEELQRVCEAVMNAVVADPANNTVTFKLAQPWAPFIPTIAGGWGSIMSKAWVSANGGWDGDCATWQNFYGKSSDEINATPIGTTAMGTGPYILDHWTPGEEWVLKSNEAYWRTEAPWEDGPVGPPQLKTVIVKNITEFSTRYAMLQAGDADSIAVGSSADWPQMDELVGEECDQYYQCTEVNPDLPLRKITGYPTSTRTDFFFTFVMNTTGGNNFIGSGALDGDGVPPDFFSDEHVRKAWAYCFDYDTYLNDVILGEGTRSTGVMLPGMTGYQDDAPVYNYDPDKCVEEFQAADVDKDGIPAGQDEDDVWNLGFRMTIAYNTGNTARQTLAQIFQQTLSAVNEKFVIEVTGLPWPTYLKNQRASKLPIFPVGWIEDIHDTHNWVQPYAIGTYGNRQNLPAELKEQFGEIIDRGVVETDPDKRAAIYHEFNQLYHEATTGLILYVINGRRYEQRWVKGWIANPIWPGTFYYPMWKE